MLLAALLEPAIPDLSPALLEEVEAILMEIDRLDGRISEGLNHVIGPLFRAAHTHHSLYIEDRPSTLAELAVATARPAVGRERDRAADLRASLELLSWLHDGDGRALAAAEPTSARLISDLHARYYTNLPENERALRVADSGRAVDVNPGAWREEEIRVGSHLGPAPEDIDALMVRWAERFNPLRGAGRAERLLLTIAGHHRLLYIHPFRDGNGRVARFALDASLIAIGLDAKGAWTPARGFARARARYYDALIAADAERRHSTDGRGARSAEGLLRWTRFVLDVIREQVRFIDGLLEPRALRERVRMAVHATIGRSEPKRVSAARLVLSAWELGPLTRGALVEESGVADRSARRIILELIAAGWLREVPGADARTAPVVGGLPLTSAPIVFPNLFLPDA
jgi:Fic family protein